MFINSTSTRVMVVSIGSWSVIMSIRCLVRTAVITVLLTVQPSEAGRCSSDEFEVETNGFTSFCYKVMSSSPVSLPDALQYCTGNWNYFYAQNLDQLRIMAETAKVAGIAAKDEGPGMWLPFMREEEAPENSEDFRRKRAEGQYKSVRVFQGSVQFTAGLTVADDLWRKKDQSTGEERDQPGDKWDERDERCVALKNIQDPDQGLDSFSCQPAPNAQYVMHYALCVRSAFGF